MQYRSKIISCLLVICLLFSFWYIDRMPVSAAGSSKIKIRLTVDNRNVSGKTVSIRKGKKKKVRVTVSRKKNARISFRSNKRSVAAVSKTGKITAKRIGTAKITVTVKSKEKKYKGWIKVKVVAPKRKNDASLPTKSPVPSPTVMPTDIWATEPTGTPVIESTDIPTIEPSDIPTEKPDGTPTTEPTNTPSKVPSDPTTSLPSESPAPDTGVVSDMYQITLRINGEDFSAKLYQTETTKSIVQKLPLSITMSELNGNEKYYYFSENFPTQTERVSKIHAGDLKLYGSSCLVLFYESFSTSYSYTSLGYVENPGGLAEVLGTGSVHVDVFSSE